MANNRNIPSSQEIDYYRTNGYVYLEHVATGGEIRDIRSVIKDVVKDTMARKGFQGRLDDYSKMFQQVTNAWRLDKRIAEFVFTKKFARIAARLLEVNAVHLYHDQALFKPAGGEKTYWHQDMFYWPLDTDKTITMWMPLVDVNAEMGTMEFACGSHKNGLICDSPISEEAGKAVERLVSEKGYARRSHELKAGDATFHSGFTAHSAFPNRSRVVREVMTVIYFADRTQVVRNPNKYQEVDLDVFLPGVMPGDIAASPLNPILYSE